MACLALALAASVPTLQIGVQQPLSISYPYQADNQILHVALGGPSPLIVISITPLCHHDQ